MKTSQTNPSPLIRLDLALIATIFLIAIAARVIPGPRNIDDSFITFRYSRNIVEGQGFVYNPGSRVLGTTTPLYTVLMAAIGAVMTPITGGQDYPYYALTVNALADGATVVLLYLLALRLTRNRWASVIPAVLWALSAQSVTFAIGGMETSVNILFMVTAVWFLVSDRPLWLGIAAGLGFLTRIDAALWIGPAFLYQLIVYWRDNATNPFLQRLPWRIWIAAGLTFLPWLVFSLAYFGSPFPRSLTAKTVAYIMPPGAAFGTLLSTYATPFFEPFTIGSIGAMVASIVYVVLTILGIRYAWKKLPALLPFLIYPWVYMIVFSIANPLIFRWYNAPPLPGLMFGIFTGAWAVIESIQRRRRTSPRFTQVAFATILIVWTFMSLRVWTLHPDHGPDRPAPVMAWHQIELYYQQVATELRDKYGVTAQSRVASADIGAVGYFSRAVIIDTVGLVTPELSRYYPIDPALVPSDQNYAIPPQLIKDAQPEYFVTMEGFVRLGLEKDAQFKAEYGEPIIKIPTGFYGTDMRVYQRKGQ
jgi:hypothetical protein